MIGIKDVAKKMSLKEFNKRFEFLGNCVKDEITGKIYYCPHDLGFNFTLDDCTVSCCKECWKEAIEYLNLKDSKVVNIKNLRRKGR